ncbi:MAG TPA: polysaccharide deacetylase family protein [Aromatoleum sp.]|uniref:polysaccharide deacetylase family protein n=1 Tax=Aromatoleum sp. TaxID=2307007 RepID=UPI002B496A36|nr:polysaccharide deacetylase family protein [Aromatoleum sp.]HJV24655.1 polysaccharide deacetylase family protein [Aromatoleum sp.]
MTADLPYLPPAVCVSLHDVAPETWARCECLLDAVAAVARIPLTLLVVPNYHRHGDDVPRWYRKVLLERCAMGDELALHGYVHCDEEPPPHRPLDWWRRRVLTAAEGEFASLSARDAEGRLAAGLDWFQRQGWTPRGFVAPAWLLSAGAWRALDASPLTYTTTVDAIHLLHPRRELATQSIVYSTRSALRRALSLAWNGRRQAAAAGIPVRVALHPNDSRYPEVIAQMQGLLERLLRERTPMTKAELVVRQQALDAANPALQGLTTASDSSAMPPPSATPASTSLG